MSAEWRLIQKHNALFCAVELTCLGDWRVVLRFGGRPDIEIARDSWRWLAVRKALAVTVAQVGRVDCPHCGMPVMLPPAERTDG